MSTFKNKTMRNLLLFGLLLAFTGLVSPTWAQINQEENLKKKVITDTLKLQERKDLIEAREKEKLREEVENINERLEQGEISEAEAEKLKRAAATHRARNIEDQWDIIDANVSLLSRNPSYAADSLYQEIITELETEADTITIDSPKPKRTVRGLVLSAGLSNVIGEGQSLNDSPYQVWGSRFFEIGYEFRTALTGDGFLRINYGLQFQFNGLKPSDNRYFVKDGEQTRLEEFPIHLKKSKLRMDNLVIPVHFEIGPANKRFQHTKFRLGLGGYAGVNLNTIQKLKYRDEHGRQKDKTHGYNTNNVIYGLSGFLGYRNTALYIKYDLNPIFKDNDRKEHFVAVGIRFF